MWQPLSKAFLESESAAIEKERKKKIRKRRIAFLLSRKDIRRAMKRLREIEKNRCG